MTTHLDLERDPAIAFPFVADPDEYVTARIWHCRYRTLSPLAAFVNLRSLMIATYPDPVLTPLAGLTKLESLSILHMPAVSDLGPLADLKALRRLSLATLPSWDSSGKVTEVQSLAPLRDLPLLRELELFGVRPPDRRVDDLLELASLEEVRITKYPRAEIERLQTWVLSRNAS
jgi:hypothetical protein